MDTLHDMQIGALDWHHMDHNDYHIGTRHKGTLCPVSRHYPGILKLGIARAYQVILLVRKHTSGFPPNATPSRSRRYSHPSGPDKALNCETALAPPA